jgi:Flp pilus assembly protein TadG
MRHRQTRGQALVEFAFTLPLFALVVMVIIQLGLIFVAYHSETRMARETARWLAINSDSTDLQVAQHIQNTMLPGLVGTGTLTQTFAGTEGIDPPYAPNTAAGSPAHWEPTVYTMGQMTATFTPCIVSSGTCSHHKRVAGESIFVEMSYDVGNWIFLPTNFRMSNLQVRIPTTLPAYRVYTLVE